MKASEKKVPEFPTEITFKAVYRNLPYLMETLKNILAEHAISADISARTSKNSTYISYTITAVFPEEGVLNTVCGRLTTLKGFTAMF